MKNRAHDLAGKAATKYKESRTLTRGVKERLSLKRTSRKDI
jgi:hypothetical protein